MRSVASCCQAEQGGWKQKSGTPSRTFAATASFNARLASQRRDAIVAIHLLVLLLLLLLTTIPSSSTTSSSPPISSGHLASRWNTLPLELLVLIADCLPSYRLLLPLSSTYRHYYELILKESEPSVSVRLSCWRRHPPVRVALSVPP